MDVNLTKEADALICVIYKNYLLKRKSGVPKGQAKFFGSSLDVQTELMPKWSPEDTDETCWELHRSNMLICTEADCIAYFIQLSDDAIIYMENRFKDGLNSVLDYLSKLKGLIPFV